MKNTLLPIFANIALAICSHAGDSVRNPLSLANGEPISKDDILAAKNTVIDNADALLDMGASIYAVSSYITPFDGENPQGFGAGIGVNFPLAYNIELQARIYWTDDDKDGSTWLGDAGVAYRYALPSEPTPMDVYGRFFGGYKGVPEADFYAGFGAGLEFHISERSNLIFEPSLLFGFDGQHALQVVGGFSWEF